MLVNGVFSFALDFEGIIFVFLGKSLHVLKPRLPHQKLVWKCFRSRLQMPVSLEYRHDRYDTGSPIRTGGGNKEE